MLHPGIISLFFVLFYFFSITCSYAQAEKVIVYRKDKKLIIFDADEKAIFTSSIGIGKGGLKSKKSMADLVTPTGDFVVDLIISEESSLNAVSAENVDRYQDDKVFSRLIDGSQQGLEKLYKKMNSLDFDSDGKPDNAYGKAYIGLHSSSVVTGPKMRYYRGTPYWYSIALHGTPDEKNNLGAANSGGCVHVAKEDLLNLLKTKHIVIGTKITITDEEPQVK